MFTSDQIVTALLSKGAVPDKAARYARAVHALVADENVSECVERHHALPRSLFLEYVRDHKNVAPYTPANHVRLHYYLLLALPNSVKMLRAFNLMVGLHGLQPLREGGYDEGEISKIAAAYEESKVLLRPLQSYFLKSKWEDPVFRAASIARLKVQSADPDLRKANSERMKAMRAVPAIAEKIALASGARMKALWDSREFVAAHTKAMNALWASSEFRAVRATSASKTMTTLWENPKFAKSQSRRSSANMKALHADPAFVKKLARGNKERWEKPESGVAQAGRIAALNAGPQFKIAAAERLRKLQQDPHFMAAAAEARWNRSGARKAQSERGRKCMRERWDNPVFAAAQSEQKKAMQADPEFHAASVERLKAGSCLRWNVRRGKPCTCGKHSEELSLETKQLSATA